MLAQRVLQHFLRFSTMHDFTSLNNLKNPRKSLQASFFISNTKVEARDMSWALQHILDSPPYSMLKHCLERIDNAVNTNKQRHSREHLRLDTTNQRTTGWRGALQKKNRWKFTGDLRLFVQVSGKLGWAASGPAALASPSGTPALSGISTTTPLSDRQSGNRRCHVVYFANSSVEGTRYVSNKACATVQLTSTNYCHHPSKALKDILRDIYIIY